MAKHGQRVHRRRSGHIQHARLVGQEEAIPNAPILGFKEDHGLAEHRGDLLDQACFILRQLARLAHSARAGLLGHGRLGDLLELALLAAVLDGEELTLGLDRLVAALALITLAFGLGVLTRALDGDAKAAVSHLQRQAGHGAACASLLREVCLGLLEACKLALRLLQLSVDVVAHLLDWALGCRRLAYGRFACADRVGDLFVGGACLLSLTQSCQQRDALLAGAGVTQEVELAVWGDIELNAGVASQAVFVQDRLDPASLLGWGCSRGLGFRWFGRCGLGRCGLLAECRRLHRAATLEPVVELVARHLGDGAQASPAFLVVRQVGAARLLFAGHAHDHLGLVKAAVLVDLVDHEDLAGVGAFADEDIHAVTVFGFGAFDVAVVRLHLGLPGHTVFVDAAAHGALWVLDADAEAVQVDRRLGIVAGLVLRGRRLLEIVARGVGRLVCLGANGLLDLIASDLRISHSIELELLAGLAVLQEELVAAALDGLEALVGQLAQGCCALAGGGGQARVASVSATSPGLDRGHIGCGWRGRRIACRRNRLLLCGRDNTRVSRRGLLRCGRGRRDGGIDRLAGCVDILRLARHVGADSSSRAFNSARAGQHVVDANGIDINHVGVKEPTHAAGSQWTALLGSQGAALLARHSQRAAGLGLLGRHHGECRAGLCRLEHLLHLSDGQLTQISPGALVLGNVQCVKEFAGCIGRQAADLLERGVAAQVGFDCRHAGRNRIDGSTRACCRAGRLHDGLIGDTSRHHGTREHAAGLLGLVNDRLQGVGCWGWRNTAIHGTKHSTTRGGCKRLPGRLTRNTLHGVNAEAFVVECDVGCVALEATLAALNRRLLEHAHASASAKASSGLLTSLAARQAACYRLNARGASHHAKQAIDGNVAGVGAVVGLRACSNLCCLISGVLAGFDQLVAHRVVDAAFGRSHTLCSTNGALQDEPGGLSLAKARNHRHQQRWRASAQGIEGGLDWGLEEAPHVGHDLVPGAARCLGTLDGVLALLALILAVLRLVVGQCFAGVIERLGDGVFRAEGVGQQLHAGDCSRGGTQQVVGQRSTHAAVSLE